MNISRKFITSSIYCYYLLYILTLLNAIREFIPISNTIREECWSKFPNIMKRLRSHKKNKKKFCCSYFSLRLVLLISLRFSLSWRGKINSSVIRQKGESQNGCFKKAKHAKFQKHKHFLLPDTHTRVCVSRGKECLFFGNVGVLCFLETPVLSFALLPYSLRILLYIFQIFESRSINHQKWKGIENRTARGEQHITW